MSFLQENKFHALVAEGAEYMFCAPPRLFSSSSLKLTFKRSLEVKELNLEAMAKSINLPPNRLCLIPAMLDKLLL